MVKKAIAFAALIAAAAGALTGCEDAAEVAARQKLRTEPNIEELGEFDGCTVKYVYRGSERNSFYLARCGATATSTNNYRENVGKTSVERRITAITQDDDHVPSEQDLSVARAKAAAAAHTLSHMKKEMEKATADAERTATLAHEMQALRNARIRANDAGPNPTQSD